MATIINASTSAGLVQTADTSGNLNLQSNGSTIVAVTSTGAAVTGTLSASGGIAKASLPTGSVLQVVNATYSTQVSSSSSTYADTGLTATITPTSATSKILVLFSQSCKKTNGNVGNGVAIKLFRGATDLGQVIYAYLYTNSAVDSYGQACTQYLDSPATTSATTYKTQFSNVGGNVASIAVQADGQGVSTITLMEIAA